MILDDAYAKRKHCNIIVTQPRRIAAKSLAQRVCDERDWELGTVVGYQVNTMKKKMHSFRVSLVQCGIFIDIFNSQQKIIHLVRWNRLAWTDASYRKIRRSHFVRLVSFSKDYSTQKR